MQTRPEELKTTADYCQAARNAAATASRAFATLRGWAGADETSDMLRAEFALNEIRLAAQCIRDSGRDHQGRALDAANARALRRIAIVLLGLNEADAARCTHIEEE